MRQALFKMSNLSELESTPTYLTFDDVLLLPNYSDVTPPETVLETELCKGLTLRIPIISAPMDTVTEEAMLISIGRLGGLGILHRNMSVEEQARQLASAVSLHVVAGAAVGVGNDLSERVERLASSSASVICLDSAHGHTKHVIEAVRKIKARFPDIPLIAGNIATYEGARDLFEAGADIVKVGMGPGSICTTRIMSGMGVPQLSAIHEAARAAKLYGRTIIADGGIRSSGDMVKALAAGASAVMLGSLLAGTDEAAGETRVVSGTKMKTYRGMGSTSSMARGSAARYGQVLEIGSLKKLVPEGVEGAVRATGPLEDHLHQLLGGLRSGLAYLGARNILELQEKARFIPISRAALSESHPHSILRDL